MYVEECEVEGSTSWATTVLAEDLDFPLDDFEREELWMLMLATDHSMREQSMASRWKHSKFKVIEVPFDRTVCCLG